MCWPWCMYCGAGRYIYFVCIRVSPCEVPGHTYVLGHTYAYCFHGVILRVLGNTLSATRSVFDAQYWAVRRAFEDQDWEC